MILLVTSISTTTDTPSPVWRRGEGKKLFHQISRSMASFEENAGDHRIEINEKYLDISSDLQNSIPQVKNKDVKTYWGKCTFDSKKMSEPPWHLEYIEGKGYLAISNYNFQKGELICRERPVTWCDGWHPFSPEQILEIERRVDLLNDIEKEAFYQMANMFPEVPQCAGIYMTNSFDMVGSETPSCGMYLAIARLNHSCVPNAQQTHIPETQEEVLYASRDIRIGDEINDCYIELRHNTVQRREKLQEIYRFHCECAACCEYDVFLINQLTIQSEMGITTPFGPDEAREKALKLDHQILSLAEDGVSPDQIIVYAEELLVLLNSSRCDGWKERYLAEVYLSIYHLAMTLSHFEGEDPEVLMKSSLLSKKNTSSKKRYPYYEMAVEHLLLAHQWNKTLQGSDSPDTINTNSYCQLHRCLKKRINCG